MRQSIRDLATMLRLGADDFEAIADDFDDLTYAEYCHRMAEVAEETQRAIESIFRGTR